jgi:hypothetical protein
MKQMTKRALLAAVFFLTTAAAFAQDAPDVASPDGASPAPLPSAFRSLSLGMTLDELKAALLSDGTFDFRDDRDVSYLPSSGESIIECGGSMAVRRAFFQLSDGKLFFMAFVLNTSKVDHYGVFTTLSEKYGPPSRMDPRTALWESETIRLTLERPLTLKYIDKPAFDALVKTEFDGMAPRRLIRQEFLDGL